MKPYIRLSSLAVAVWVALSVAQPFEADAKPRTHIPAAVAHSNAVGHMAGNESVRLAIALPPRDRQAISAFVDSLYDPNSPDFHQFITPEEFGARFGSTEADYNALQDWAKAKGLTIVKTHKNRLLLSVEGSVGNIEKAFKVSMNLYKHPREARNFFSADREPTIDAPVAIASIEGLSSYWMPHAKIRKSSNVAPKAGTGPSGTYMGNDFRKAYVPGTTLTGSGQSVGLLQFDGFYTNDIVKYRTTAGLPNIPLTIVNIDGGVTSITSDGSGEVSLDIEMCMSMAPGLSRIYVYEAPNPSPWMDIIGRMADDNLSRQLSCSWGGGDPDDAIEVVFQQMASQGQSFFNASGDSDALIPPIDFPSESPSITQVGGTTLTTSSSGGWSSEVVWNWGYDSTYDAYIGSSGGVSDYHTIPDYQTGISMTQNNGSTEFRNIPDVAMTGDNVYVTYGNGSSDAFGGTSCAAPLWAGFMALVNQANVASNHPPAGFINPLIYGIGKANKVGAFHDVTSGNNTNDYSDGLYPAVQGYDLCTGWGTPGTNLLTLFSYVTDLRLTVTDGPLPAEVNTPLTFDYSITNAGPLATTNATLTATFSSPVGIDSVGVSQGGFVTTTTKLTCNLGAIATNGSAHVTLTITPLSTGYLTNTATVTSELSDPNPQNSSKVTVVAMTPADLAIGNIAPATVFGGYPISYCIAVTNFGPYPASGVTVVDTLPDSVGFVTGTTTQGDYVQTGNTVKFNVGYLDVNYIATMTVTVLAPIDAQTIENSVTVSANEPDPVLTNNDASASTDVIAVPPPIYNVNAIGFPTAAAITWNTLSNGTTQVAYGLSTNYGLISTFDATVRTNHLVFLSGLVPDSLYYFQVSSVVSGAVYTATGTFTTTATLIMQEPDAAYDGDWTLTSATGDKYGSFFQYAISTTDTFFPNATATFNASLPKPGRYDVAMWYPSGANHSTNAQVSIAGASGISYTRVNQATGGHWVPLGAGVDFSDGSASVAVMNNTGETSKAVIANAVKFSYSVGQDSPTNGAVPAWWSQLFFGTNGAAGSADADGDGYSNFTEYVLGTIPNDPASRLTFSSRRTTNGVQIVFGPYQGGRVYQLQYRANLSSPWTTLVNAPTADANGNGVFTVSSSLTGFFRLQARVAP